MKQKYYMWIVYLLMIVLTINSAMGGNYEMIDYQVFYITNNITSQVKYNDDIVTSNLNLDGIDKSIILYEFSNNLDNNTIIYFKFTPLPNSIGKHHYLKNVHGNITYGSIIPTSEGIPQTKEIILNTTISKNDELKFYTLDGKSEISFDWIYIEKNIIEYNNETGTIGDEETEDLFNLDLTDTFIIVLIGILLIGGIIALTLHYFLLGGLVMALIGLLLVFNGLLLLGFIIFIIGFIAIISDDDQTK